MSGRRQSAPRSRSRATLPPAPDRPVGPLVFCHGMSTGGSASEARATSAAPGIWRLELPLPGEAAKNVNGYLLADRGSFTLVDCGWAGSAIRTALGQGLASSGAARA